MARYYGTRRYSVWETFEFDANSEEEALRKLKEGFFLSPVVDETKGEEYSDFTVEKVPEGER